MERSLLDTAINVTLMILELQLYERIIEGKDTVQAEHVIEEIQNGDWRSFTKEKTILKYQGMIGDLEDL